MTRFLDALPKIHEILRDVNWDEVEEIGKAINMEAGDLVERAVVSIVNYVAETRDDGPESTLPGEPENTWKIKEA